MDNPTEEAGHSSTGEKFNELTEQAVHALCAMKRKFEGEQNTGNAKIREGRYAPELEDDLVTLPEERYISFYEIQDICKGLGLEVHADLISFMDKYMPFHSQGVEMTPDARNTLRGLLDKHILDAFLTSSTPYTRKELREIAALCDRVFNRRLCSTLMDEPVEFIHILNVMSKIKKAVLTSLQNGNKGMRFAGTNKAAFFLKEKPVEITVGGFRLEWTPPSAAT